MRVIYLINYIRTILVVLICLILKIEGIVKEDLKRNLWYIGSENANLSSLNKNLLKNKCFRNIVCYRIHEKNKVLSVVFRILYPIKARFGNIWTNRGGGSRFIMDMELL